MSAGPLRSRASDVIAWFAELNDQILGSAGVRWVAEAAHRVGEDGVVEADAGCLAGTGPGGLAGLGRLLLNSSSLCGGESLFE